MRAAVTATLPRCHLCQREVMPHALDTWFSRATGWICGPCAAENRPYRAERSRMPETIKQPLLEDAI